MDSESELYEVEQMIPAKLFGMDAVVVWRNILLAMWFGMGVIGYLLGLFLAWVAPKVEGG